MEKAAITSVGALALVVASVGVASAQGYPNRGDEVVVERPSSVDAPNGALELGIEAGYVQGFGTLDRGRGVDLAEATDEGVGAALNFGWRVHPHAAVLMYGGFQQFRGDDILGDGSGGTDVRGLTTGVMGSFHFGPHERIDPFVNAGTGYRMLWTLPAGGGNDVLTHGFQLARLDVGFDVRVSESVALGPVVGGDLTYFVWNNPEGPTGNVVIDDRRVHTFFRAGLQGRFDIGGSRRGDIDTFEVGRR